MRDRLTKAQRRTLFGGLLLVLLAGLFPPRTFVWTRRGDNLYVARGRGFLLWPGGLGYRKITLSHEKRTTESNRRARPIVATGYVRIDYYRLGLEFLVVTTFVVIECLFANPFVKIMLLLLRGIPRLLCRIRTWVQEGPTG